jgi:hypothetical protein
VNYEDVFYPKYFEPPLHVFPILNGISKELKNKIIESFALYYADNGACANKIRQTLEVIMDEHNVPRNNGKGNPLTLHARILKFKEHYPNLADHLLAVKIIGNSGSHEGEERVEDDDLRDAFRVFHYCLNQLYDKSYEEIKAITDRIHKKRKSGS